MILNMKIISFFPMVSLGRFSSPYFILRIYTLKTQEKGTSVLRSKKIVY